MLVLPLGENDITRVNAATRTIAVLMPNLNGIDPDWQQFITTVDEVEALTGYNFFANLPDAVENAIEAGINGTNPPGTENQSATTAEDTPVEIALNESGRDSHVLLHDHDSTRARSTVGLWSKLYLHACTELPRFGQLYVPS